MKIRRVLITIGAGFFVLAVALSAWKLFANEQSETMGQDGVKSSPERVEPYPVHESITTTVFWVGEEANPVTNENIHNNSSAWVRDWEAAYGGIDDPSDRCGYDPCGFEPKENPFYFALPFGDYDKNGPKPASEIDVVPWFDGAVRAGESILKNRWIQIVYQNKTAYAQWEDVGPFGDDDASYVFGTDKPKSTRAGLDVSPAVADFLGFDGRAKTSWRFVDDSEVPSGPWREIITTSGPRW